MAVTAKSVESKNQNRSLEASGYYSDYQMDGILYAALIRNPATAGKVRKVSIQDLPEDCYLYTAEDIPGKKIMELNKTSQKIFGYDNVNYNGEALGILLCPDEYRLKELMSKVNIAYSVETLESALKNVIHHRTNSVLTSSSEASQSDYKRVLNSKDLINHYNQNHKNGEAIPNLLNESTSEFSDFLEELNEMPSLNRVLSKSDVEKNEDIIVSSREVKSGLYKIKTVEDADKELFSTADFVCSDSWSHEVENPKWQETCGAFCYTKGKELHVYVPTKWTYFLQQSLSEVLNINKNNIFIHKTKCPGLYSNGLWRTSQIAIQAAVASFLSKKPVKLVLSHKEQSLYMNPAVKTDIFYKAAVKKNGKIEALKILIDLDIGCSNPFAKEITDRISIAATNYYKPENLYIYTKTHTSKNPPTSISIKTVEAQAFFAIENEIQRISDVTNLFPDEIREINCIDNKEIDFPFNIPVLYMNKVIEDSLKNSDFSRKFASYHMDAIDRAEKDSQPFFALPLRGIGLSSAYNVSGYHGDSSFSYDIKIEVILYAEERAVIHTYKPSKVIQDIWKKTVSECLQIPAKNVEINPVFEISQIPDSPEDALSTLGIVNELLKKCCNEIQKKRFHQPLPISSKKGLAPSAKKNWNKETFYGNPFYSTSSAASVVEVELDPYTYNEKIKGVWISIACGEVLDLPAAENAVKLEVQQELSMLVKDKTLECDTIKVSFVNSKGKSGQVGGLVHNTLPAAFSTALSLALNRRLGKLPCDQELLYDLIHERETKLRNPKIIVENKYVEGLKNSVL